MDDWTHLANAPIVEGLIDLKIDPRKGTTFEALKAACDDLAPEFPGREEIRSFSGEVSFSIEKGTSLSAQSPVPFGMRLRSTDEKWVAQFRLDGFTLSRLHPYTTWAELSSRARELWNKYCAAMAPEKITRVATRFINRLPLAEGKPLDETFVTTFSVAATLPQTVGGFLLRIILPFGEDIVVVTQSLQPGMQECTFDIDAFAQVPTGFSEDEAWSRIEGLRRIKNRVFFESLTPGILETLK